MFASDCVEEGEEGWVCGCGWVFGGWREEVFAADAGGERDDFDAVGFVEDFFRYGSCSDSTCLTSWDISDGVRGHVCGL